MSDTDDRITIQSITSPGHAQRVNCAKYMAMREALVAKGKPVRLFKSSGSV